MTDGKQGLRPGTAGVNTSRQRKKTDTEAPSKSQPHLRETGGLSDADLLEGGLDDLPRLYFKDGWADDTGQALPHMLTLRAAQLAKAWSRLGANEREVLGAIALLDSCVSEVFETMNVSLPPHVRQALIDGASKHRGPEAICDWLQAATATLLRFSDVAGCCAHLMQTVRYMRLELAIEARHQPLRRANLAPTTTPDAELERLVLVDDAVYQIFKAELGEDE